MIPFLPIIEFLALLAFACGIVYLVTSWIRRGRTTGLAPGIGLPRRFYFYSISFIALMMTASGIMITLDSVLDLVFGGRLLSASASELATGLSLAIVGLPLWGFHWRFIQRSTLDHPVERDTIVRNLYLYVSLGVGLGFLAYGAIRVIEFVLRVREFSGLHVAALVVWGLLWLYHWRVKTSDGPEATPETRGLKRVYVYVAAAFGGALLAVGVGSLVYVLLRLGYASLFDETVFESDLGGLASKGLGSAAALTVVGCVVWWAHWITFSSADRDSALRWFYLFLVTVGGGAVTALVGLGMALYTMVSWVLGASTETAEAHFEALPAQIAVMSVGVALWAYHRRRMVAEATGRDTNAVARSYDLLVAAIGLIAIAVAAGTLVDTFLQLISDSSPVVLGGWRMRLATTLTTAAIGLPVWWRHWRRIHIAGDADPPVERTALPRKLYVLGVLCIGLLAFVGGASATLFILLRDLLDGELSSDTLRDLASSAAVVVTALAIVPYHWTVYREDRALEPDAPPSAQVPEPKSVTLLAAPGASMLVSEIESALGYSVTVVPWLDTDAQIVPMDGEQVLLVAERLELAPGRNVLLIPDSTGLRVISHD